MILNRITNYTLIILFISMIQSAEIKLVDGSIIHGEIVNMNEKEYQIKLDLSDTIISIEISKIITISYVSEENKESIKKEEKENYINISSVNFKSKFRSIIGFNNSKVIADDTDELDYLLGLRFGVEKTLDSGFLAGATFSQKGFSITSNISEITYSTYIKWKMNYLTGYIVKPFTLSTEINLLAGGEIGYFLESNIWSRICDEDGCETDTDHIDSKDWDDASGNMFDYGFILGGSYRINPQISIVGTYYIGVSDLYDNDLEDWNNRSFQIYLNYQSGLKNPHQP